jgi:5-methylcytosine-specific restriction endonuclease McrA
MGFNRASGRFHRYELPEEIGHRCRPRCVNSARRIIGTREWPWHGRRSHLPRRLRAFVLERDGFRCAQCGSDETLELDHILRYRDGGADRAENLRVLCRPCNRRRG